MGNRNNTKDKKKTQPGQKKDRGSKENNIVLDFSLRTVWASGRNSEFCNFLTNEDEFLKKHKIIFDEITSIVSQHSFENLYLVSEHCHLVSGVEVLSRISNAMIAIYMCKYQCERDAAKEYVNQILEGQEICQIGIKSGIRLFCIKEREHHLKVILIDYHHLIYPSIKHNSIDIKSYAWSIQDR